MDINFYVLLILTLIKTLAFLLKDYLLKDVSGYHFLPKIKILYVSIYYLLILIINLCNFATLFLVMLFYFKILNVKT